MSRVPEVERGALDHAPPPQTTNVPNFCIAFVRTRRHAEF